MTDFKAIQEERLKVLVKYIGYHIGEYGYPPTYREMMLHLDLRSTSTIKLLIDELMDRDLVAMAPGKARTLRLL